MCIRDSNMEDGCYSTGPLSYLLDETSMIVYTIDDGYCGDKYWREEKIMRNVFCYDNNVLLQSRMYPDNSSEKKSYYRQIVQKVFADALEKPNFWTVKYQDKVNELVRSNSDFHYHDYDYSDYKANVSLLKDEEHGKVYVGSGGMCLSCGGYLYETEYPYCENCNNGGRNYCEYCEEHTDEDVTYVEGYGYVCETCLENNFVRCCECGEWFHVDDAYETYYGDWVCRGCFEDCYFKCDECGEIFRTNEDSFDTDHGIICSGCFDEKYAICESCGQILLIEDMHETENGYCCDECYEEHAKEESAVA